MALATLWGLIALLLALPYQSHAWIDHTVMADGASSTETTSPPHPTLWLALCIITAISAALAPLAAQRLGAFASALSLAPFIPLAIESSGFNIPLAALPSLIGVASVVLHHDRARGWLVAAGAATIPLLFTVVATSALWVIRDVIVSSSGADPGKRVTMFALYALGITLAMGTALALSLVAQRRAERQAVAIRSSEIETRAAIARDLHDVVAHRISLVAVRAETAPYQLPDLSDAGRQAMADIAADARAALDDMRQVLGVLDRGGDHTPDLAPQPQGADIATLVGQARDAGSPVILKGQVPPLGDVLGNTVYRVVQEALTNARRHAPNQTATVAFSEANGGVTLLITNPTDDRGSGPVEMGRGLAGMRERIELSGGMFHVKHEGGEFVVEARWPEEACARE